MSYYILPKNNNILNINPIYSYNKVYKPYLSYSLLNYYNEITGQIKKMCISDLSYNNYEEIIKVINPYEYIFSKVPGSKYSVSKLKTKSNLFYDFLELSTILNIFDPYKNSIKTLHLTSNNNDTIECLEMLRENYRDEATYYDVTDESTIKLINNIKFNFLIFETKNGNLNEYITSLVEIMLIILRNQSSSGCCIIKIQDIFYKPIVDILYLLSSLYDRIYVFKPNTSNITTFDKYIVCKNFQTNEEKNINLKMNYYKLLIFLKKINEKNIVSILDSEIPYFFLIKLYDINIIFGQQQLESLNLVMNILKNKNKEEKIEIIKKSNIQKSVAWCEKYKIPCNKFSEKTNIFLPINKEITIETETSSFL